MPNRPPSTRRPPECSSLDPLVTPYVDGELDPAPCETLRHHLDRCPPCRARIEVERSVRDLLRARQPILHTPDAPSALRARCASLCRKDRIRSRPSLPPWLAALGRSRGVPGPFAARVAPMVAVA